MTKTKILTVSAAVVSALVITPAPVLAQNTVNLVLTNGQFLNVASWNATRLAQAAINLILVLAGLVAFFFLLLGGLQWILAGGDKDATEKARKRITAALIGLVITFAVYALVAFAGDFLGVTLNNFTISNV